MDNRSTYNNDSLHQNEKTTTTKQKRHVFVRLQSLLST
jgi:hypothetical protein